MAKEKAEKFIEAKERIKKYGIDSLTFWGILAELPERTKYKELLKRFRRIKRLSEYYGGIIPKIERQPEFYEHLDEIISLLEWIVEQTPATPEETLEELVEEEGRETVVE